MMKLLVAAFVSFVALSFGIDSNVPITDSFTSTLPIVKIDLNGQDLNRETRVPASFEIIWNDQPPNRIIDNPSGNKGYSGKVAIRYRGNRSYNWTLKPYSIVTTDADGDDVEVSLMGFPPGKNFILKGPGPRSNARSLYYVRDAFGMQLFRDIGRWAPRNQFCELFIKFDKNDDLQDQYQGVYLFEETIRRGKYRVDIDAEEENNPNRGWLMTRGGTDSTNEIVIHPKGCNGGGFGIDYPDETIVTDKYKSFIRKEWEGICQMTTNWTARLDAQSFMDYFLLLQLVKADDTFNHNAKFSKNTNGPIMAGPPWDLELGLYGDTSGWLLKYQLVSEYINLMKNYPNFLFTLKSRWFDLRQGPWKTDKLVSKLKKIATDISFSLERELCDKVSSRFDEIITWTQTRVSWMDQNMAQCCPTNTTITQ
jgi:hypothetical protein